MTELDTRIRERLITLGDVIAKTDPKLGKAMTLVEKDYELRALVVAVMPDRHIYWYVDRLHMAHLALSAGDELEAKRYLLVHDTRAA